MHPQMVAHKAFQELDKEGKGFATKEDLIAYLKKYYIRISEIEAEEVIREFDATEDGTLNVEEFQQIILPSANQNLRRMADLRVFSYSYKANEPQAPELSKSIAVLIEKEVNFQKKRDNIKRQLLS